MIADEDNQVKSLFKETGVLDATHQLMDELSNRD
jgi:hypothetical protein